MNATDTHQAEFDQRYASHLRHLNLKGLQPKTIEAYSRGIRRLGEYFEHRMPTSAMAPQRVSRVVGLFGLGLRAANGQHDPTDTSLCAIPQESEVKTRRRPGQGAVAPQTNPRLRFEKLPMCGTTMGKLLSEMPSQLASVAPNWSTDVLGSKRPWPTSSGPLTAIAGALP